MKNSQPQLILASASPRRVQLLTEMGLEFTVQPSHIEEKILDNEPATACAERLARIKAEDVAQKHSSNHIFILGADTLIHFQKKIIGKPQNPKEAKKILQSLSGQKHEVITGYCLIRGQNEILKSGYETSEVEMKSLSPQDIENYVATGEPMDKAGAYAIQGKASAFIASIKGSRNNIIGLPTETLEVILKQVLT